MLSMLKKKWDSTSDLFEYGKISGHVVFFNYFALVLRSTRTALNGTKTELTSTDQRQIEITSRGNGMKTTLMSDEERRFMWNLAFSFTIKHRGAAFKAYYAIRSFITFHGIFMAQWIRFLHNTNAGEEREKREKMKREEKERWYLKQQQSFSNPFVFF